MDTSDGASTNQQTILLVFSFVHRLHKGGYVPTIKCGATPLNKGASIDQRGVDGGRGLGLSLAVFPNVWVLLKDP